MKVPKPKLTETDPIRITDTAVAAILPLVIMTAFAWLDGKLAGQVFRLAIVTMLFVPVIAWWFCRAGLASFTSSLAAGATIGLFDASIAAHCIFPGLPRSEHWLWLNVGIWVNATLAGLATGVFMSTFFWFVLLMRRPEALGVPRRHRLEKASQDLLIGGSLAFLVGAIPLFDILVTMK